MNLKSFFQKNAHKPYNEISFLFDENKIPHIKIYIEKYEEADAKEFGTLLFSLNRGYLMTSILEILISLSKEDGKVNTFVQQVVSHWVGLDNIYKNRGEDILKDDDEPSVRPTEFLERFKNGS